MFDEKKKSDEEIVEETTSTNEEVVEQPAAEDDVQMDNEQEKVPAVSADAEDVGAEDVESTDEQDTFPREYVEKLRDENAKYRQRAQQVDEYAKRLHTALTAATGRLQDASDLPFDQSHLDDPEELSRAIQELLANKPHLGSRKPSGNIGQGVSRTTDTIDLAGLLRSRA